MKPITVKQLYELCKLETQKGNGDKVIMISNDDEGNGYHYLWYDFSSPYDYDECDDIIDMSISENVASKDNTIILG
ncbi:MAG: hypothetical protein J6T15_03875 [Bacilli bacterium]|nr:hypothetical protein [Bacilli bacterium]